MSSSVCFFYPPQIHNPNSVLTKFCTTNRLTFSSGINSNRKNKTNMIEHVCEISVLKSIQKSKFLRHTNYIALRSFMLLCPQFASTSSLCSILSISFVAVFFLFHLSNTKQWCEWRLHKSKTKNTKNEKGIKIFQIEQFKITRTTTTTTN